MPDTTSKATTDHDEIRRWAKERNAKPVALLRSEENGDPCVIRLHVPGSPKQNPLQPITWDEWFKRFEERELALLYQEELANGDNSNFHQIVTRAKVEKVEDAVGGKGRSASSKNGVRKKQSDPVDPDPTTSPTSGRARAAKRSESARGRSSTTARPNTRSRSAEQRSSETTSPGATRANNARHSRTRERGGRSR